MKGGKKEMRKIRAKKAQQDIIVTVLLVLVALAAVAIVAAFIVRNVKQSTVTAQDKADCSKVELEITQLNTTHVTLRRLGDNSIPLKNVTVTVNGAINNATNADMTAGVTKTLNLNPVGTTGQKVAAYAVLADGYACSVGAEDEVI
jgi:hypothetical protein